MASKDSIQEAIGRTALQSSLSQRRGKEAPHATTSCQELDVDKVAMTPLDGPAISGVGDGYRGFRRRLKRLSQVL